MRCNQEVVGWSRLCRAEAINASSTLQGLGGAARWMRSHRQCGQPLKSMHSHRMNWQAPMEQQIMAQAWIV